MKQLLTSAAVAFAVAAIASSALAGPLPAAFQWSVRSPTNTQQTPVELMVRCRDAYEVDWVFIRAGGLGRAQRVLRVEQRRVAKGLFGFHSTLEPCADRQLLAVIADVKASLKRERLTGP